MVSNDSTTGRAGNCPLKQLRFIPRFHLAPVAGLLNKSSHLALALGVTKIIIVTDVIWVTVCCAT
jgi:hypothetical protein